MEFKKTLAADANVINRNYLDRILVEMRNLDSDIPDISMTLFGKTFSSPIMTPAFAHMYKLDADGLTPMEVYSKAAEKLNIVNFIGMEPDDFMGKILELCPNTVRIIKPFADHDRIYSEMDYAREHGALAVGMDIDHIFHGDGSYDEIDGLKMGPVTAKDLKAYIEAAGLPFVVKGVLSVTDALKCREAGAAAIMVSHHHGRIPYGIPPLMILPAIKEAVGDTMKIFVDCGIDDGCDAYKALALGADAVCVGRALIEPIMKEGTKGVIDKINHMNGQLMDLMEYTNIHKLEEMTPDVLYIPSF